jgi:hypothetical protein
LVLQRVASRLGSFARKIIKCFTLCLQRQVYSNFTYLLARNVLYQHFCFFYNRLFITLKFQYYIWPLHNKMHTAKPHTVWESKLTIKIDELHIRLRNCKMPIVIEDQSEDYATIRAEKKDPSPYLPTQYPRTSIDNPVHR